MQLVALGLFALILPVELQVQVQNPTCGARAPISCSPTSPGPEQSVKFKKYESFKAVMDQIPGCSAVGQVHKKSASNSLVKCAVSCLGNSSCRSFLYSSDGDCMACTSPAHELHVGRVGAGSWSLYELSGPDAEAPSTTEQPLVQRRGSNGPP